MTLVEVSSRLVSDKYFTGYLRKLRLYLRYDKDAIGCVKL
jgi:hypothetical protein